MSDVSRRVFLACGAGAWLAGRAAPAHANPLGLPIGSQTYPHRALIKEGRFADLLRTLAGIDVQTIELCSPFGYGEFAPLSDAREVRTMIADHGLTCVSGHFSMRELRQTQDQAVAWASGVGIAQMITASLGSANGLTVDGVKRAAEEYNRIAERAAAAGIQQGLHNEGFEMSTVDGQRTYDLLFQLLDPKLVKFQFQMSTITRGFDAAEYFTKHPGRFCSMHLQDWNPDAQALVAVGDGRIDWKQVFGAAKIGGVKNYFIEQNMEMTGRGAAYLKTLTV